MLHALTYKGLVGPVHMAFQGFSDSPPSLFPLRRDRLPRISCFFKSAGGAGAEEASI